MGTRESGFYKKCFLYQDLLTRDLKAVSDFYYQSGYLDARVVDFKIEWSADSSEVDISITLDEGEPVLIDSIEIIGIKKLQYEEIHEKLGLEKGNRIDFKAIAAGEAKVMRYYGNRGHLAATISKTIIREGNKADLIYSIDEGPQYVLGKVQIEGNEKTKNWVIKDEFRVERGGILTLDKIDTYRQRLYRQGLYRSIHLDIQPTPFDRIRDLRVIVEEKEAGELSFGGGYGSEERLRLSGHIGYINLYGRGTRIGLRTRMSSRIRSVETHYHEPHFLGSRFFFESGLSWRFNQEPNFDRETDELYLLLGRLKGHCCRFTWGYKYRQAILMDISPELAESQGHGRSSTFFTEANYDNRDSKIFTRRGIYANGRCGVAEPYALGDVGFLKAVGEIRGFKPIFGTMIFAVQGKSGRIFRLEEEKIPLEEMFFLGGAGSVRGYERNSLGPKTLSGTPTGGKFYYFLRGEIRLNLWKPLWIKTFFDNGGLFRNFSHARLAGSDSSGGLGLQVVWGIWTARIDYAWRIDDDILPGEIYFDVGQVF